MNSIKQEKKVISLQTERLQLLQLSSKDADLVLDYLQLNLSHFQPWIPLYPENYYTSAYQQRLLKTYEEQTLKGSLVRFWLFQLEDNNNSRIIGDISFTNIIRGALQSCHVGYRMDRDFVNKGYMTEALKKAIDFIFTVYKLHRIEANIMPFNEPSIELVENLGFAKEGFSPNYLKINGRWENHLRFGLVNHELEKDERANRADGAIVISSE